MEDLEGVSMLRDVLDVLLVHLLDAVLPGHVLHQVLELLKSLKFCHDKLCQLMNFLHAHRI